MADQEPPTPGQGGGRRAKRFCRHLGLGILAVSDVRETHPVSSAACHCLDTPGGGGPIRPFAWIDPGAGGHARPCFFYLGRRSNAVADKLVRV